MLRCAVILGSLALAFGSQCAVDLVFVMDESQSVTEKNWPKVTDFVDKTVGKIASRLHSQVGPDGVQVALVPFNTYGKVLLHLDESTSMRIVKDALVGKPYHPGLSNIYDGLDKADKNVLIASKGDRAGVPNIVFLISDGVPTQGTEDPVIATDALRKKGAKIVVIGVDGANGEQAMRVNRAKLVEMADSPDYVFSVDSYDGLFGIVESVAATVKICKDSL